MLDALTRTAAAFAVGGAFALAIPAAGAAQEAPAPAPAPAPVQDLSDAELETFAEAYVAVNEIARETEASLATVQDPEQAQALQMEAQERMTAVLDEHDLEAERYRQIGLTLNQDADLRERFVAILQESQGGPGF